MIEQLSVKDYVLFESCYIDFNTGMSVITGETGAGKSLLIDAIGLLSGNRVTKNVVRKGKEKAVLNMVLTANDSVNAILEENGFDTDDQIIISRIILANNKSTVRINQQVTTLNFLKQIVSMLVDIHSQMDTYHLMDSNVQMELLDTYANTIDLKKKVKDLYQDYTSVSKKLSSLQNEEFSDEQLAFLTDQLNEIHDANIEENEFEELNEKIRQASLFQKNKEDMNDVLYQLDQENGALDTLYTVYKSVSKSALLNEYSNEIQNMYYALQDLDEKIKNVRDTYSTNLDDIDSMQERLYFIKRIYRKYGGSFASLQERKKTIEEKIDHIIHRQDVFDKLEHKKEQAHIEYLKEAKQLSSKRKRVFKELENQVMQHCKDLMLENARFKISCQDKPESSDGLDAIDFLVSMNPGQDFSPLKHSASGGELSRFMLALKVVFQAANGIETIIFDEIDTGVSGKVALAMGSKMKSLSKQYQVLCITHLASVAVYANTHYLVSKMVKSNNTVTTVQELDHDSCIKELATMASGNTGMSACKSMQDLWEQVHG